MKIKELLRVTNHKIMIQLADKNGMKRVGDFNNCILFDPTKDSFKEYKKIKDMTFNQMSIVSDGQDKYLCLM